MAQLLPVLHYFSYLEPCIDWNLNQYNQRRRERRRGVWVRRYAVRSTLDMSRGTVNGKRYKVPEQHGNVYLAVMYQNFDSMFDQWAYI